MKVLAIMGSPRKGDSYGVTRQLEVEMQKIGPESKINDGNA